MQELDLGVAVSAQNSAEPIVLAIEQADAESEQAAEQARDRRVAEPRFGGDDEQRDAEAERGADARMAVDAAESTWPR